jgi:hypothetical protein
MVKGKLKVWLWDTFKPPSGVQARRVVMAFTALVALGRALQITHNLYVECPLCGFTASKETWQKANPVPDHEPD